MTALHTTEVLRSIAEGGPGPARDWANARLAIATPGPIPYLPSDTPGRMATLMAGPIGLTNLLLDALAVDTSEAPARAAVHAGQVGLLPEDPGPLASSLRRGMGAGSPRDLWSALALASIDEVDAGALNAAARGAPLDPDGVWALPVLVLNRSSSPETVDAVAAELAPALDNAPRNLWGLVSWLGGPPFPDAEDLDPDDAATLGVTAAGAVPPRVAARGSRRVRGQRWIERLLDGVAGPLPQLLRALYARRLDPPAPIVALAGWLAHPIDALPPLGQVLERRGGYRSAILTAARRAVQPADADAIAGALRDRPVVGGAGALACALRHDTSAPHLAETIIDRILAEHTDDPTLELAAFVLAARVPDRVRALLRDRETRGVGLALAEWVPTEEILEVLLELPLPSQPAMRARHAWTLASMGDTAAIPALRDLAALGEDPLEGPLALASSLLGVPLAPGPHAR